MKQYDYLIVGSGLFGATFAYLAKKQGKKCLIIDKRSHLGGNIYCENIEGINVHKYGAHIFHTNNKEVWDYVNSFVEFNRYTNSPLAYFDGKLYNLPFNMNTFYQLWGVKTPAEAKACVQYQIGALKAFCDAAGVPLHHVKPHGALYNMAGKDRALADAICAAVKESAPGAVLLALSGSEMVKAAQAIGLPVANEVFADRGYRPDGSLVPRGTPGAMIEDEDEAIARVIRMVTEGKVTANDGTDIAIQADSVCVHGDGPKALAFVEKIGAALQAAGVELKAF